MIDWTIVAEIGSRGAERFREDRAQFACLVPEGRDGRLMKELCKADDVEPVFRLVGLLYDVQSFATNSWRERAVQAAR